VPICMHASAGPLLGRKFTFDGHDVLLLERTKAMSPHLAEKEKYVSRMQFLVEANPPHIRLVDLGNPSGTFVNGKRVTITDLHHHDEVKAGHTYLRVDIPGSVEVLRPIFLEPSEWEPDQQPGPATSPTISPPEVPGYRIEKELGRNLRGAVYQAISETDGAIVAIKTFVSALAPAPEQARKLLKDADALCELQHPHILPLHEVGEAYGTFWFVRDCAAGMDIGSMIKERGKLDEKIAVRIIMQVLSALEHAHEHGFGHGHLTPSNVFLDEQGDKKRTVKVADFGLSHCYSVSPVSGLTLTVPGACLEYMAPERVSVVREITADGDQFSAAAILYRMLTDRPPYDVTPTIPLLSRLLEGAIVPLRQRRHELDPKLAAVVEQALAREPAERYQDVKAFAAALLPFAK